MLRCRSCYGGEEYALEQMLEFEGACGHCFGETHIYSFYLGLISGAARTVLDLRRMVRMAHRC